MIAAAVIACTFVGLSLNLAFASSLQQPDWALAMLLAALLAQRSNWVWVLPMMMVHDAMRHWSFGVTLMAMAAMPLAMIYFDQHLGPGIPQRVAMLLVVVAAMIFHHWAFQAILLTALISVPIWYLLTRRYAKAPA